MISLFAVKERTCSLDSIVCFWPVYLARGVEHGIIRRVQIYLTNSRGFLGNCFQNRVSLRLEIYIIRGISRNPAYRQNVRSIKLMSRQSEANAQAIIDHGCQFLRAVTYYSANAKLRYHLFAKGIRIGQIAKRLPGDITQVVLIGPKDNVQAGIISASPTISR